MESRKKPAFLLVGASGKLLLNLSCISLDSAGSRQIFSPELNKFWKKNVSFRFTVMNRTRKSHPQQSYWMPHSLRYETTLSPNQEMLNNLLKHKCFPKSDQKDDSVVLFCQSLGGERIAGLENESPKFEDNLNSGLLAVISQVSHSLICC